MVFTCSVTDAGCYPHRLQHEIPHGEINKIDRSIKLSAVSVSISSFFFHEAACFTSLFLFRLALEFVNNTAQLLNCAEVHYTELNFN